MRSRTACHSDVAPRPDCHVPEACWDEQVHEAFLAGCFAGGLASVECRREQGANRLEGSAPEGEERSWIHAARRANWGWLVIDLCLFRWGELAALALERAVEEARLLLARETDAVRVRAGQAILDRAGGRLARFWTDEAPFAA